MVHGPCVLADIGCDHGLLPIALVKKGVCTHAYACDINPGPLSRAQEAIAQAGLQQQITTCLCDGISQLDVSVNVIVIAGMGYDTIVHILEQDMDALTRCRQILIQCNGHEAAMRHWLTEHHFMIDAECFVKERHLYQLISFHKEAGQLLNDEQCIFGVYLKQDALFQEYWELQYQKKRMLLQQLPKHHEHYKKTEQYIVQIKNQLKM